MLQYRAGFWRTALWGAIAVLTYCVFFWNLFAASINAALMKTGTQAVAPPDPALSSVVSALAALLVVAIGVVGFGKLQAYRTLRVINTTRVLHDNFPMFGRLALVAVILVLSTSVRYSFRFSTERGNLFTLAQVSPTHLSEMLHQGAYHVEGPNHDSSLAGVYHGPPIETIESPRETDRFAKEFITVTRTRFGWPLATITRDVSASEWYLVFESFWFGCLIFTLWIGWLVLIGFLHLAIAIVVWNSARTKKDPQMEGRR